jgi:REP element-mobilizing transposase RayT
MARIARVVAPGLPHHVTQRGNCRQPTFLCKNDYEEYLRLMSVWSARCKVAVLAYCLMPNHVHMIMVPQAEVHCRGQDTSLGLASRHGNNRAARELDLSSFPSPLRPTVRFAACG